MKGSIGMTGTGEVPHLVPDMGGQSGAVDPAIGIGSVAPVTPEKAAAEQIARAVAVVHDRVEAAWGTRNTYDQNPTDGEGVAMLPLVLPRVGQEDQVWLGVMTSPADPEDNNRESDVAIIKVGPAGLNPHEEPSLEAAVQRVKALARYMPGLNRVAEELRTLGQHWGAEVLKHFGLDFRLSSPDGRIDTEAMQFPPQPEAGVQWYAYMRRDYDGRGEQMKGTPPAGYDVELSGEDLEGLKRMIGEAALPSEL